MWARDRSLSLLVGREGIEPPQPKAAGLQPAELTTCSTYPLWSGPGQRLRSHGVPDTEICSLWSRRWDSNPQPAVYKTAALPIELRRRDRQGPTADDPIRRREMIGPAGVMGQACDPAGSSSPESMRHHGLAVATRDGRSQRLSPIVARHREWR